MKKYEILYDWIILRLTSLCDSPETEIYVDSIPDGSAEQEDLLKRIDLFRAYRRSLTIARANKQLFIQFGDVRKEIDEAEMRFPAFPNLDANRLKLILLLSEEVALALPPPVPLAAPAAPVPAAPAPAPDFDETDVNDQLFELRIAAAPFPVSLFVRQNTKSFPDSVVVFVTQDIKNLENAISQIAISPEMLFHLLATIISSPQIPNPQAILVKRETPPIDNLSIESFAKLLLLASGKAVHSPFDYTQPPSIVDVDSIRAGNPYHQLNEVFYVMSEYNSRSDLLAKYLSIYHVVENFMFKLPLVELERRRNGQMFSIRDFRKLYQELDIKEMIAVKKLMSVVFQFSPVPGKKFEEIICDRWNNFCPVGEISQLNDLLERLGVERGRGYLTHPYFGENAAKYFGEIVYRIRCIIVHNTETEWHLSYATLDKTTRLLIEKFLLPSLEEIIFAFVGQINNHVWYRNKSLTLY